MAKINLIQSFNSGTRFSNNDVEADVADINAIVALMPDGVTAYSSDGSDPVGTARAVPTHFVNALIICKDTTNRQATPSFIGLKYAKTTLSSVTASTACVGVVKLPNNTACDKISMKNYDMFGSAEPTA